MGRIVSQKAVFWRGVGLVGRADLLLMGPVSGNLRCRFTRSFGHWHDTLRFPRVTLAY